MGRDALHWFRFSRVVGVSRFRAVALFPLVLLSSFAARTAEMTGNVRRLVGTEGDRAPSPVLSFSPSDELISESHTSSPSPGSVSRTDCGR